MGESARTSPGSDRPSGLRIGDLQVRGPIASGAFGSVFAARDVRTGEDVALKWVHDATAVSRLKREFTMVRALRHPNLVRLLELHDRPDGAFFTMELIEGPGIAERCRAEPTGAARVSLARRLFVQLADGVAHLHGRGLVHGDIKPSNVRVAAEDRPVLLDFDLAGEPVSRTRFSGTFPYAAPELFRGRASPSSDWFAFGVVLYEALTGHLPHGDAKRATVAWYNGEPFTSAPTLPPEAASLAPMLDALMAPDPSDRAGAARVQSALRG